MSKPRCLQSLIRVIPVIALTLFSIPLSAAPASGNPATATSQQKPGKSVYGKHNFIEYVVGNLPIIISVPHGGYLTPAEIPDRELGSGGRQDVKTQELAREIIDCFLHQTGRIPHVIINRLHRVKLDANREQFDATLDDPIASVAWKEFHGFIDSAQHRIENESGTSLYIDLHGHRHSWQIIELGYLLVNNQLLMSDAQLDSIAADPVTSFGRLINRTGVNPSRLIRGDLSFGAQLQKNGYASVPSPETPHPQGKPYFSGGYNLGRHSAFSGQNAWGIQVELPTGIRENETRRRAFTDAFVRSILGFLHAMSD